MSTEPAPQTIARSRRARVRLRRLLRGLGPAMSRPKPAEAFRAGIGAGLALALCAAVLFGAARALGQVPGLFLIAPLGATTFLVFGVPNSPLAQPWSAIIGNGVSAAAAVAVLWLGLPEGPAAGLAVAVAMVAMSLFRALHPPGAAVALATVLGAQAIAPLGLRFVLTPVMLDTVLIVAMATVWNRATGRVYPFRQPAAVGRHATLDPGPERRLGLSAQDLAAVLDRFNLAANIGAEDFGRILAAAEEEAARRHFDDLSCGEVMSRDVVSVAPDERLGVIADLFRRHRFKTVPVVETDGRLVGIITQNDLIQRARHAALGTETRFAAGLRQMLDAARGGRLRARDIMTAQVQTVRPEDGIGVLVHMLADGGVQAAPVVEGDRLAGIVTRSDLIAVLSRRSVLAGAARGGA